jgi:hypothetical protein
MEHTRPIDLRPGSDDGEHDLDPIREIALGRLLGKRDAPDRVADAELRGVIRLAIRTAQGRQVGRRSSDRDRA